MYIIVAVIVCITHELFSNVTCPGYFFIGRNLSKPNKDFQIKWLLPDSNYQMHNPESNKN